MAELILPPLRTVALSEPLWLDASIYAALETPARDRVIVFRDPHTEDGRDVATLRGAPTQDPSEGPRAMWPRMAEFAPGWQLVYQRGDRNAYSDGGHSPFDVGPSVGIWPVAVRQDTWLGSLSRQATAADGSQGIFGYLDGKWWSFDAIRQSSYAAAYPDGVIFHGWREKGVLHLLFTEGSASVPDRVILCTDEGGRWNRFIVFQGRAEFPRGCSTPAGVYVHAVGEDGQYRAAMSPFLRLEETPVAGVTPNALIHAWETAVTLPDRAQVAVETVGDEAFLRYRVLGSTVDWTRVSIPVGKGMASLPIEEPGDYALSAEARSQGHPNAITTAPRSVLVRPAVIVAPPEPTPPQVITEPELDVLAQDLSYVRETATAKGERAYYNARCAGETHAEALATCRRVIADAVLTGE